MYSDSIYTYAPAIRVELRLVYTPKSMQQVLPKPLKTQKKLLLSQVMG